VELALELVERVLEAIEGCGDGALHVDLIATGAAAGLLLPEVAAALDELWCVSVELWQLGYGGAVPRG
jgi:hypothetical protein